MPTFKLHSGYTVTTERVPGEPLIEFITRNENGEAISTVHHSFAEATPLIRRMTCGAR